MRLSAETKLNVQGDSEVYYMPGYLPVRVGEDFEFRGESYRVAVVEYAVMQGKLIQLVYVKVR